MILDLTPYGLKWQIDTSNPAAEIIPVDYKTLINKTVISGSEYIVGPIRDNIKYTKGDFLGAGSYGNVYQCKKDGGNFIVKEMIYDDSEQFKNTIAEVIIQIIVVKETESSVYSEYKIKGPFAPRVYNFGYNPATGMAFIFAEQMHKTVRNLIRPWSNEDRSIAYILSRIAIILSELYTKLSFNHRDFKSDNCMYVRDSNGNLMPRIIDFGFACIKYNNITINSNTSRFKYCNIEGRDMSQMIYENAHYYPNAIGAFAPVADALLTFVRDGKECKLLKGKCGVSSWSNTYRFFNSRSGENPNGHPGIVKKVCLAFFEGRDWRSELAYPKRGPIPAVPIQLPALGVNPCPNGKNYNPKTRRCVNPCLAGKVRNASFKCVKAQQAPVNVAAPMPVVVNANPPIPKRICPPNKPDYNPKTNRCVTACPPGKRRNTNFKCK